MIPIWAIDKVDLGLFPKNRYPKFSFIKVHKKDLEIYFFFTKKDIAKLPITSAAIEM